MLNLRCETLVFAGLLAMASALAQEPEVESAVNPDSLMTIPQYEQKITVLKKLHGPSSMQLVEPLLGLGTIY